MRPRALRLERHELAELRRRLEAVDAETRQLVLREIDAAELPVLVDVADDVDELERDSERLRMRRVVGAVHRQAREADRAGDLLAVAAQLGEVGVRLLLEILEAAVDERRERLARDAEALARVGERDEDRIRRRSIERGAQRLERDALRLRRLRPVGDVVDAPRDTRRSPRSRAACRAAAP